MAESFKKLWQKLTDGTIKDAVVQGVYRGMTEGVAGVYKKRGEITSNIGSAYNNAHPAAKACLIVASGISAYPAAEAGYGWAMMNPEKIITGIGIADNLFLGGTPFGSYKEFGATLLHDYNPWAVK